MIQNPGTATEGNAELLDIRIGFDGTQYSTAGNAVRAQIDNSLKFLKYLDTQYEGFDFNTLIDNGFYWIYNNQTKEVKNAPPSLTNDYTAGLIVLSNTTHEFVRAQVLYVFQNNKGDMFLRYRNSVGTWFSWHRIQDILTEQVDNLDFIINDFCFKYINFLTDPSEKISINNLTEKGYYQFYINSSFADLMEGFPEEVIGQTGVLINYPYNENPSKWGSQLILSKDLISFRTKDSLGWTEWNTISKNLIEKIKNLDISIYFKYISYFNSQTIETLDLNECLERGYYWIYKDDTSTNILNLPKQLESVEFTAALVVYRYNDTYLLQVLMSTNFIALRNSGGSGWKEWQIIFINDIEDIKNNIDTILNGKQNINSGMSAFDSIVVIGDSLSVGYTQLRDGTILRPLYKQSWPQYLVKKYNMKVYWGGSSGAGVLDILDNVDPTSPAGGYTKRGWDYIESLGKQALYFIILGVNDAGQDHTPVGEVSDIGTTNRTFYGGLSQIVEKIHTFAPKAYVILSTPIQTLNTSYKTAIKDVAEYYNEYSTFIDFSPYVSDISNMRIAGHYSQNGYFTAGAILDYLSGEAIKNNANFIYINDANNDIEDNGIDPYE